MIREQKAEIDDLQAEFERERQTLLDQLRKSEQEILFYQAYVDRVQPLVRLVSCLAMAVGDGPGRAQLAVAGRGGCRRDCNYSSFERIKRTAVWNEEENRWMMPKPTTGQVALPDSVCSIASWRLTCPRQMASAHAGSCARVSVCVYLCLSVSVCVAVCGPVCVWLCFLDFG